MNNRRTELGVNTSQDMGLNLAVQQPYKSTNRKRSAPIFFVLKSDARHQT